MGHRGNRGTSLRKLIGRRRGHITSDDVSEAALAALERYEAILENIGDGVFTTGPDGTIDVWNQAAQRLTGCSPKHATGRGCAEILGLHHDGAPLDCSRGCALMALTDGRPTGASIEVSRRGPDGREQPLLVSLTAISDARGGVTEVAHAVRDISSLKAADEAKTMFLATASHELKTPLTVILGFTQALRSDWLDPEQRQDALASVERRAQELGRIVDRLLLTGRIESGRISLSLDIVDVGEMIDERARSLAMVTGRTFHCDLPAHDLIAVADPDALSTVLDHLLDNAVKYSPGGEDISIRLAVDRRHIEIEVADRGIGMDEAEQANCFKRFWQAESSDVRRFGGTGVGLYIVRSLVEAMGGRVSVRSLAGSGTTFTVRIRRAEDHDRARAEAAEEPAKGQRTMIHEFMHQIGVPTQGGGS